MSAIKRGEQMEPWWRESWWPAPRHWWNRWRVYTLAQTTVGGACDDPMHCAFTLTKWGARFEAFERRNYSPEDTYSVARSEWAPEGASSNTDGLDPQMEAFLNAVVAPDADAGLAAIPLGLYEGANRYETDDTQVLSVWVDGRTYDAVWRKDERGDQS